MAIKAKITQIDEKNILIERLEKGDWIIHTYSAEFRATGAENTNTVTLGTTSFPFQSISLAPDEYEINGEPNTDGVSETAAKLNGFVGNFKGGGGSSEKTRFYTNGHIWFDDRNSVTNPRDGKTPESAFMHTGNLGNYFRDNVDVFYSKGHEEAVYGIHREIQLEGVTYETAISISKHLFRFLTATDTAYVKKGKVEITEINNKYIYVTDSQITKIADVVNSYVETPFFLWNANSPLYMDNIKNSTILFDAVGVNQHFYFDTGREINLYNSAWIIKRQSFESASVPPAIHLKNASKLIFEDNGEQSANPSAFEIHKYPGSMIVWDNRYGKTFAEIYPNVTIVDHGGTV